MTTEAMQQQEYELQHARSKLRDLAIQFGFVHPGWTVRDYILDAVKKGRYCLVHIWGEQGSMKSNRTLQQGSWVYGELVRDEWHPFWDKVLDHIIFRPGREERGLLWFVKQIPYGKREAWVGWDDLGVHYPSTIYKTDIEKYQAIDSAFAAIRTKISTMTTNNPLIDRVAKNIKDNITIEEFIGPNQTYVSERLCRIVGVEQTNSRFFKILIESGVHDWKLVPSDVWKEYWDIRLRLADEAINVLDQAYAEGGGENMITVRDAVKTYGLTLKKILTYVSRGVIQITKRGGESYMRLEDVQMLQAESGEVGR
jgi:hypothetical protein